MKIARKSQNLYILRKRVKKIEKSLHIEKTCKENRKKLSCFMKLKTKYEKIVNEYLRIFIEKQGFDAENCYWIGDKIGEIFSVNEQYYFSLQEIRFDVDNNIKAGAITDWQDEAINNKNKRHINYENYIKLNEENIHNCRT